MWHVAVIDASMEGQAGPPALDPFTKLARSVKYYGEQPAHHVASTTGAAQCARRGAAPPQSESSSSTSLRAKVESRPPS